MKPDLPTTRFIRDRRSIRRFVPAPVPEGIILDILDCARLAPSAHNSQPWLIGAVTEEITKNRIADFAPNGRFISQSAVCFAVFSNQENGFWLEDGCASAMNIITAASAHGVGTCWVAGAGKDYADLVRDLLGVPENFSLVALVPAGYPARAASSAKKPFEDVVFFDYYTGADGGAAKQSAARVKTSIKSALRHRLRKLVLKWL